MTWDRSWQVALRPRSGGERLSRSRPQHEPPSNGSSAQVRTSSGGENLGRTRALKVAIGYGWGEVSCAYAA
jgi:hypothetical protein